LLASSKLEITGRDRDRKERVGVGLPLQPGWNPGGDQERGSIITVGGLKSTLGRQISDAKEIKKLWSPKCKKRGKEKKMDTKEN
jgi:hypothetical protein